jgi:hypothetical protein
MEEEDLWREMETDANDRDDEEESEPCPECGLIDNHLIWCEEYEKGNA